MHYVAWIAFLQNVAASAAVKGFDYYFLVLCHCENQNAGPRTVTHNSPCSDEAVVVRKFYIHYHKVEGREYSLPLCFACGAGLVHLSDPGFTIENVPESPAKHWVIVDDQNAATRIVGRIRMGHHTSKYPSTWRCQRAWVPRPAHVRPS